MVRKLVLVCVAIGAVSASLTVFALYLRPEFMLTLSNQVWGCF